MIPDIDQASTGRREFLTSELGVRIASGVVMMAVALGLLWHGGALFWAFAALIGVVMIHEWCGLAGAMGWQKWLAIMAAIPLLAYPYFFIDPVFLKLHQQSLAVQGVDLVGVSALLLAVITFNAWLGAGLLYVTLPVLALVFLRQQPDGLALTIWTLAIVWATDIGAYFSGRAIGGPKLAPRISPNKTWAGLIGGVLAAAMVGFAIVHFTRLPSPLLFAAVPLAVLAQAGDLFESWFKRRAGVKDSGRLLPGHGGALDRLDGVIPVAVVVAGAIAGGWL